MKANELLQRLIIEAVENGDYTSAEIRENVDVALERVEQYVAERLEDLRGELRAERISYGELAELQGLAEHIDPGDVELREAAGLPEQV